MTDFVHAVRQGAASLIDDLAGLVPLDCAERARLEAVAKRHVVSWQAIGMRAAADLVREAGSLELSLRIVRAIHDRQVAAILGGRR
jgi:hypothetical protein